MDISVDVLVWMTVGIALLSSEAFTGSFHLLFLGLSALLTAAVASLGVNSSAVQLICFSVLSVASVGLLRRRLVVKTGGGFAGDVDARFTLNVTVPKNQEITVQYQGAPWTARNVGRRDLTAGETVRVVRTEGIKLLIAAVDEGSMPG